MTHTLNPSKRRGTEPAPRQRPPSTPAVSSLRQETPLLSMQAHWSMPAHRSYLHAATFHWQR